MGFFSEETQKTSISLYIEKLSNLDEIDWYLFEQLTESIQMQENGGREAIETIRKKLKHGGTQQKLRVIELLKLLMENTNQQFHKQFLANEKIKERFDIILNSPSENSTVKKELISLLGTWRTKYKNDPGMKSFGDLYDSSSRTTRQSSSRPSTDHERQIAPPIRAEKTKAKPNRSPSRTGAFDFEKSKPKILEEIALANSNSNNLVNALKLVNTSEDRWEIELQHDRKLQGYHEKCEESKKKIIKYARLVEDEEWIGTLLATNEDLLKALDMYDIMLAGQIPAVWSQSYPERNLIEDTLHRPFNNLQISKSVPSEDELTDPFADPPTPDQEDQYRRDYLY